LLPRDTELQRVALISCSAACSSTARPPKAAWFSKERKAGSSDRGADRDSANDGLLAVYKQLEKATQTGDGNLFLSLMSQKKIEEAKNIASSSEMLVQLPFAQRAPQSWRSLRAMR
jgi:hypothetical protein